MDQENFPQQVLVHEIKTLISINKQRLENFKLFSVRAQAIQLRFFFFQKFINIYSQSLKYNM